MSYNDQIHLFNANVLAFPPIQSAQKITFDFKQARPLSLDKFPNRSPAGSNTIITTLANVEFLLASYEIEVFYNVITKKIAILFQGKATTVDNAEEILMNYIISLAALNGMPISKIHSFVATIAYKNPINPAADWMLSNPWDGIDRLTAFYETLVTKESFPLTLKEILMYSWMLSVVAATLKPQGFKARGVLTLQGRQSIGKTSWVKSLIPDPFLCEQLIKIDHHLDAHNKDSMLTALSHLIVEIGELDSSLNMKGIARLKGFLTSDMDKIRRPYARTASEYPRRTVFVATVNEDRFLIDATGNSRFWTLPLIEIIYEHGIDMQQLFAQLVVDFNNGATWWLSKENEALLETLNNANHKSVSVIQERVINGINSNASNERNLSALSASEVLMKLGIRFPSNLQAKECAAILRELLGDSKRINGINKWRVSFNHNPYEE